MSKRWIGNSVLLLGAMIWGAAFVAQSVGMDYLGPFTFQAARSLLGALVLLPVIAVMDKRGNTHRPVTPAAMVPRARPAWAFGVSVAIKALELLTKPAKMPWAIRNRISSQTFWTSPIAAITIAIPSAARNNIGFRPIRSANLPHSGEVTAETMYMLAKTTPE